MKLLERLRSIRSILDELAGAVRKGELAAVSVSYEELEELEAFYERHAGNDLPVDVPHQNV